MIQSLADKMAARGSRRKQTAQCACGRSARMPETPTQPGQSDVERGLAALGAARRERGEYEQQLLDIEETAVELFNPPDNDTDDIHAILRRAAEFIEAQPCYCTPALIEDNDACERCNVLGRQGDEPRER